MIKKDEISVFRKINFSKFSYNSVKSFCARLYAQIHIHTHGSFQHLVNLGRVDYRRQAGCLAKKPSSLPRFALNHRRPIIEGVLALQRRLVSGAPREIGRTTGGRALVPPFVRRRQASVVRTLVRGNYRPNRSRRTNLL